MSFGHPSSSCLRSLISSVSNVFTVYSLHSFRKELAFSRQKLLSTHTHIQAHTRESAHTHAHAHTYAHTCILGYTYARTHAHTCEHALTCTHTHTSGERLCSPVAVAMKGDSDHTLYDTTDIGTGRCMLRQTHIQVFWNRTINFGCMRVTSSSFSARAEVTSNGSGQGNQNLILISSRVM